MNLLLLEPDELDASGRATVTGDRALQTRALSAAAVGFPLRVGLRDGSLGRGRIVGWEGDRLHLEDIALSEPPPPRAGLGLLLAMPRPKAFKRILPIVATLGLDQLVLLNAFLVNATYFDSPALEPASLRRLFDLGLTQAIDTRAPRFSVERRLDDFAAERLDPLVAGAGVRWLLDPRAPPAPEPVHSQAPSWIAVGPETGWVEKERELFCAHGFTAVSLGPRTLRTETVVPYALGWLRRTK